nr:hypothetical protein [Tanacetum cinerariifolium]
AQIKLYKTHEDKELDKVIALENKVKVLDNIEYKIGQSVQTMNMLNSKCRTSFAKLEFFKKAQRANHRLYDIGCYNDNLALMLAPESDKVIRLERENRSKLSDLIRPFDYDKLNNLYDLFVPQREKSSEQRYFSERSRMSHTPVSNGNSKESFKKQTTLLEKRLDKPILWDQKCKSSKELFKIKKSVGMIFDGVERCKETITKRTYFGYIDPFIQNTIEANFCPEIQIINADLEKFYLCLKEEMVADLRYFNSLELEVDSLRSQLETQKTQFLNEIDRLSKENYYVDHINSCLNAKNSNINFVYATCGKCVLNEKHYMCVLKSRNNVNSRTKVPIAVPVSTRESKRIVNKSIAKPLRRTVASESTNQKPRHTNRKLYENVSKACSWWYLKFTPPGYKWKPKSQIGNVNPNLVEIILFIVDSGCSKHMTGNLKLLIKFVEKFLGTVKFRNDQIAPILGYGDLIQGEVTESQFILHRDGENLDKMKGKVDVCIFVGYSTQSRAYRVFNKRTKVIVETIRVNFDELPQMGSDQVGSKSSAVTTDDTPIQRQQQNTTPLNNQTTPDPTYDEFINIFCTPVQDQGETSSRHVDSSNMHTFYQHHPSEHCWTKDHPLEQVIGNPSQSVRARRQLESDGEMCEVVKTMLIYNIELQI